MMAPPKTLAAAAVRPSRRLRRMGCMYAGDNISSQSPVPGSQLCCRPDGSDQAIEYFPQLRCLVEEMLAMLRGKVGELLGNHELSFHLDQRSPGSSQEIMEFAGGETRLALRNVRGNSHRRCPQLAGESVKFVPRKGFAGAVNVHHKIHGLLPCNQVPV